MTFPTTRAAAAALALVAASGAARAHEREFTLSRDWFLPYSGELEFESRSFFDTTHGDYRGQLEFEYGVTDWFAIEPGLEYEQVGEKEFEVEGAELEFRFHFGEFELDTILPALNVEFEFPFESDEDVAGELKFVLSRYGSSGDDFTLNVNVGSTLENDRESESEATFGWLHNLDTAHGEGHAGWHHGLGLGLELLRDFEEDETKFGPLVKYRVSEHLNLLGSYVFGIDGGDENADQLAFIVEWEV